MASVGGSIPPTATRHASFMIWGWGRFTLQVNASLLVATIPMEGRSEALLVAVLKTEGAFRGMGLNSPTLLHYGRVLQLVERLVLETR